MTPGRSGGRIKTGAGQLIRDDGSGLVAQHRDHVRERIARCGVDEGPMHDEPVELGVLLDELQVGLDARGDAGARTVHAGDGGLDAGGQHLRHAFADGDVERGAIGEVPVDHGLRRVRACRYLVHADAGAVLADGLDCGVDELAAAGAPVGVPPGGPLVTRHVHGTESTWYFGYRLLVGKGYT